VVRVNYCAISLILSDNLCDSSRLTTFNSNYHCNIAMNSSEYAQERDMFDIPSPFTSQLGTDFVPNDEEAAKIRDVLASGTSKLARISSDLTRVKSILLELENQHKALMNEMDAHRALLSPLRRELIPVDLLQKIFHSCLPIDHDSIICKKEAPVLLTQVCSSWRRIALNTPLLWASINIPVPYTRMGGHQAAMDLIMANRVNAVREWLKRSQDCPLSFTLDANWAVKYVDDLLDLLLPESTRWQRVDMTMAQHHISMVMGLDPRKTPLLISIRMHITRLTGGLVEDMASEEYLSQFSLFQSTNLRTLSIVELPMNSTTLPLKWSELSHLSLDQNVDPLDIFQILGMLKACIRLRSFQLTVPIYNNATARENRSSFKITDSLVSLPFLTKFSVVLSNVRYNASDSYLGPTIFDSIELPVLNDVNFIWGHYSEHPPPLLSFLRNHGRTVTKLSTNTHLFSQENLIPCLRCCPNLIELRIEDTPDIRRLGNAMIINYHFLKQLSAADNSGEILCPQLELLDLPVLCSDQEVLDFLSKKQGLNVPWLSKLKLLRLKFSREQEQPLAKAVQPFIDKGLCLALDYHTREPRIQVTFKNGSAYRNLRLPSSELLRTGTILF